MPQPPARSIFPPTAWRVPPMPLYTTPLGEAYLGDAASLLKHVPDGSVDLVLTSPPFALARPKGYGNKSEADYADWFLPFASEIKRVLAPRGSFVLEMGWAYTPGRPVRSVYNVKTLLRLCEEQDWVLAQEFYWYNPAKLPSPAEWVTVRKIRVKDAVSPIWWLAKTDDPRADWTGVRLDTDLEELPDPTRDPGSLWFGDESLPGAQDMELPTNLLAIANTGSNSWYQRCCRGLGVEAHPARFPERLPAFFIRGLTEPGALVLDIFSGSNTVGYAAQALGRRWAAFEEKAQYLAASAFRFLPPPNLEAAGKVYSYLCTPGAPPLHLDGRQPELPAQPSQGGQPAFNTALSGDKHTMGTSIQLTLAIDAERFNQLGLFLNIQYQGWKITAIRIDHPQESATFTFFLPQQWSPADESEFQELYSEHLLREPPVLLEAQEPEPPLCVRSGPTTQMVEDLLGALLGLVGEDGYLGLDDCYCHEGLTRNQSACAICWARNMYFVYQWAQAHLA
jgi:DNA modification methylase